jgi:uncharacterized protein Yka (UPF0111/DUF47 family)
MYTGEAEMQARRKILAVLQDEGRRVLDAGRELANIHGALVLNDEEGVSAATDSLHLSINDVEAYRRALSRQLAELGSMMINREDLLRAAYTIEEVANYLESIAFRLTQLRYQTLKKTGLVDDLRVLFDLVINILSRMNETIRTLQFNPLKVNDLIQLVERGEREMDEKYRSSTSKAMKEINDFKDLILIKDVLERIETVSDLALSCADLVVIISLGI